jgi:hypothetical protein
VEPASLVTRVLEGCPCVCGCLEDDAPNGGCRCVEDNCPCALVEAELWHTPRVVKRRKMDAYSDLFAGACTTCDWVSQGLETMPRALDSARQHARAKNEALYKELMADGDRWQQEGLGTAGSDAPEAGQPAPQEPAPDRPRESGPGAADARQDRGDGR